MRIFLATTAVTALTSKPLATAQSKGCGGNRDGEVLSRSGRGAEPIGVLEMRIES